jgi:riboflavin kinase/FMN adenylyltransferase
MTSGNPGGVFALPPPAAPRYRCGVLTRTRLDELPALNAPLHLAMGFFDGVHLGHQAVIGAAVEAAARDGGLAGVLTFHPHPCHLTNPGRAPAPLLENLAHKARVVAELGAGLFIALKFDEALARMTADEFIDRLTAAPVRTVAVGDDWRFGCGRTGDVALLRERGARDGFAVAAVPMVLMDGERVSSTRIRQAVRDGALATAARMLVRPYTICGTVIPGRKLAHQLGFPTANLDPGAAVTPPDGVWVVRAAWGGHPPRAGVANLGLRPTVDGATKLLEVHLFDFSGDLYAREIDVEFVHFLRPEIRFGSLDALRDQIAADTAAARQWLAGAEV